MPKQNILVFCSHSDDQILGPGATLAKYAKEGKQIVIVIFSYGEVSPLKKSIIIKRRVEESKRAGKILGCKDKDLIFFSLPDGRIASKIKEMKIEDEVKKIIDKYKPVKIFTHSPSDPMPDHRTVNKLVFKVLKDMKTNYDLYSFDIWNVVNLKERAKPRLYVDITKFFDLKIKALKEFKSQRHIIYEFIPTVYARAKLAGEHYGCKYAERFHKLL